MTDLEWLKSRRADAFARRNAAISALEIEEAGRLQALVEAFDVMLAKHRGLNYKPAVDAARQRERLRRMRQAVANAERRKLGLIDEHVSDDLELPPPEPPVPIREVGRLPEGGDHVIADDINRCASTMISVGYSFARRRSRRYEGLR